MRLYLQALTKAFYAEHSLLAIKDFNTCTQQFKPAIWNLKLKRVST